jgi:hypothetical protein
MGVPEDQNPYREVMEDGERLGILIVTRTWVDPEGNTHTWTTGEPDPRDTWTPSS